MTTPSDQIAATLDLLRAAMECEQHVFVDWSAHVQQEYTLDAWNKEGNQ